MAWSSIAQHAFDSRLPHEGVRGDSPPVAKPPLLTLPRGDNTFADRSRGFARARARDLLKLDGRDFDVQIDPVEQRTRNAPQVILDFPGRSARFARHLAVGAGFMAAMRRSGHSASRVPQNPMSANDALPGLGKLEFKFTTF